MYVRPATTDDVGPIRAVARASWEADYPGTLSRDTIDRGLDEWYAEEVVRRAVADDDAVVLVAVADRDDELGADAGDGGGDAADRGDDGSATTGNAESDGDADGESGGDEAVVGFAHAYLDGSTGSILRVYVRPADRRHAVGSRLLTRTVAALYGRGVGTVEAMALSANDPANAFYEAADFELDRTAETTVGDETHEENVYVHAGGRR